MTDDNETAAIEVLDDAQRIEQLEQAGKLNRLLIYGLAGALLLNLIAWVLVAVLGGSAETDEETLAALASRASLGAALTRLVALADERVVGVVEYWKDGDRLAFLGLSVHPDFRRRGVARALVRNLERIGSDSGCLTLGLHTVRQTGNVGIFERLGFRVESEARTSLFESDAFSELAEVAMTKRIATGKLGED